MFWFQRHTYGRGATGKKKAILHRANKREKLRRVRQTSGVSSDEPTNDPPAPRLDRARLEQALAKARAALLAERGPHGHWEGELSSSALSTATAVTALDLMRVGCGRGPRVAQGGRELKDGYRVKTRLVITS